MIVLAEDSQNQGAQNVFGAFRRTFKSVIVNVNEFLGKEDYLNVS